MILVIDNYDSFTYNLVDYLKTIGEHVTVALHDAITPSEITAMDPSHILLSPGPGNPNEAGISLAVIEAFADKLPILGVCLGHQCLAQHFGGKIVHAKRIMHGKTSEIIHKGTGLFSNIPSPFTATRYHSLIVEKESLPSCFEVTALTEHGEIMGLQHDTYPLSGVQFHPESILTEHGHALLKNFLQQTPHDTH